MLKHNFVSYNPPSQSDTHSMPFPLATNLLIQKIQALAIIPLEVPIYIIDTRVVIHDLPHIPI